MLAVKRCLLFAMLWPVLLPTVSWAVIEGGNAWPINLGITGVRADLKPSDPTTLVVVEVLADSPAAGKINVGDRIVGVNGRPFATPHRFGYGMKQFGYEGPMMDVGKALEESQGPALKGKFTFLVAEGNRPKAVELELPTMWGQFSKTFPANCDKTDKILTTCYAYLGQRQKPNGSWHGRPHINTFAVLALLASGKEEYRPHVQKAMRMMADSTKDKVPPAGLSNWRYSLYGIALAEYYLATRKEWVLAKLKEIRDALLDSQLMEGEKKIGGWGHNPEFEGYGPICIITAQAHLALGLMMHCGLEVDASAYHAAHLFLSRGTNNIGYVWYADGNGGNNKYADMGRTGASALAHAVSPIGGKRYQQMALANAQCIGRFPNTFFDTHGSALLGMAWTGLGARVHPLAFRRLMDYHVWFFNLSHCPDGTFYFMPNRDPNSQDYRAAKYLAATAATALILSSKHKSLCIMGARPDEKKSPTK